MDGWVQLIPNGRENLVSQKATRLVKQQSKGKGKNGEAKVEEMDGEIGDDFVSSYLNLDNIDTLNVSGKTNGVESSDKEAGNGANLTSTD
ncbi:hypothetical protein Ddye_017708 [Dipteronia dyeriana]|uniref:Uncharacterized protein n=1 Tax=Dipteronia dyeriana TaxID=168575 RepID=A0AAD9X019_9ROSI|nr:hypothetical protein Ddye_017708 [Dipteronia dyeriana]